MKKSFRSNWKSTQLNIQKRKKNKLAILILGIILITLFTGNILRFLNNLSTPHSSSFEQKTYTWDGESNLNLIYKAEDKIDLIVVNPGEKKISILEMPPNTFIEVPGGFGNWELRAIFGIEKVDPKKGAKLLKDSLTSFTGLPIEGYLQVNEDVHSSEVLKRLNKNPFTLQAWLNNIKTDLSLLELMRLYLFILSVRSDNLETYHLLASDMLQKSRLADGTEIYLATDRFELFIAKNLSEPNIKSEQKTIAVLNGTEIPGLAQKYSRIISSMGGNVIISDNTEYKIKNTQIFGEESKSKERFTQIFTTKYGKIINQPADSAVFSVSRAQITIILGDDIISQ